MLYAVKDGTNGPQLRSIRFASDLANDEVLYDGPITMKSDGLTIDMAFDKRCGLRPKNDDELLAEAKEDAVKSLKQSAEAAFQDGCETSLGFKMDCDVQSVSALHGLYTFGKFQGLKEVTVCDYDNKTHQLSWADFEKMLLEVGNYHQSLYGKKWTQRQKIADAQSEAEIKASRTL